MRSVTVEDVLCLPVSEREKIAEAIWESLVEAEGAFALSLEQEAELDHRIALYESDPTAVSSWQEVRSRIWPEA
jgi:putative addiction module component (TIGR02574 family)